MKFISRSLAVAIGTILFQPSPSVADELLLKLLNETDFFSREDEANDELREAVAVQGINALNGSNRVMFLDAENLAEEGFVSTLRGISQSLELRGFEISDAEEIETSDGGREVKVNGKRYRLYDHDDITREDDLLWTRPGLAFWQVVSENIAPGESERFYLLGSANDLSGIFLPERVYRYWVDSPEVAPKDRPYVPNEKGRSPYLPDGDSWGWTAHEKLVGQSN
jgi:hypothetical protein